MGPDRCPKAKGKGRGGRGGKEGRNEERKKQRKGGSWSHRITEIKDPHHEKKKRGRRKLTKRCGEGKKRGGRHKVKKGGIA